MCRNNPSARRVVQPAVFLRRGPALPAIRFRKKGGVGPTVQRRGVLALGLPVVEPRRLLGVVQFGRQPLMLSNTRSMLLNPFSNIFVPRQCGERLRPPHDHRSRQGK